MIIRTPKDLGAVIRDRRRKRRMDQQELAKTIGVSRQWVVEVEKGKPRAEVGLVLRALEALGVVISIADEVVGVKYDTEFDIDQIIQNTRKSDQ